MTILGIAESFKTMNLPDPTVTLFDGLFLGKYKRWRREILTRICSNIKFVLKIIGTDIFDSLKTMRFSAAT